MRLYHTSRTHTHFRYQCPSLPKPLPLILSMHAPKKYPTTSAYECNLVCNCSLLPSLFLIYLFSLVHADTLAEPLFFVLKKHDAISVMQLFFICTSKCSELSCLVLCVLKYFEQVHFTHLSPYRRCLAVVRHCVNS